MLWLLTNVLGFRGLGVCVWDLGWFGGHRADCIRVYRVYGLGLEGKPVLEGISKLQTTRSRSVGRKLHHVCCFF